MVTALTGGGSRERAVARMDQIDELLAGRRVSQAEYDTKRAQILAEL
jgi:hypothetical protein